MPVRRPVIRRVIEVPPEPCSTRSREIELWRHTFASLLLQNGESPAYVKEQMGHSSIQVTVDVYGHLIPGANRQAVDRLDEATGRNPRATRGRAAIKS